MISTTVNVEEEKPPKCIWKNFENFIKQHVTMSLFMIMHSLLFNESNEPSCNSIKLNQR